VAGVEPVSLIVTALVAGAAKGGGDAVTEGVKDAYAELKAVIARRFAERPPAQAALAEIETQAAEQGGDQVNAPWRTVLEGEIVRSGADGDADLLARAQALMELLDAAGARAGRYTVDARGSQGAVIGDSNTVTQDFRAMPGPPSVDSAT